MGENIGDVGGLEMAYAAYKVSLKGKEAPVLGGFTGDQRFFMAHAQVWRSLMRDDALRNLILTNPHAPPALRGSMAGAQHGRLVRGLRRQAGRQGIPGAGAARADLVASGLPCPEEAHRSPYACRRRPSPPASRSPRHRRPGRPRPARRPPAKPALGTFGIDTAQMDTAVKPGDDFFRYVNGSWLATADDPARPGALWRLRHAARQGRGGRPRAGRGARTDAGAGRLGPPEGRRPLRVVDGRGARSRRAVSSRCAPISRRSTRRRPRPTWSG